MEKLNITEQVPIDYELVGNLTEGKATDIRLAYQKLIDKYGRTLNVDINAEDGYNGYNLTVAMSYIREETDEELGIRKSLLEVSKQNQIEAIALQGKNQLLKDKKDLKRLKTVYPEWFEGDNNG